MGANRFSTTVSRRRKNGLASRKNQAGQGHEVDGGGRRRRCSSGKAALLCLPERSPARRRDARVGPRDPAAPWRTPPSETLACDCRSRSEVIPHTYLNRIADRRDSRKLALSVWWAGF